jgi:hypothetical protein
MAITASMLIVPFVSCMGALPLRLDVSNGWVGFEFLRVIRYPGAAADCFGIWRAKNDENCPRSTTTYIEDTSHAFVSREMTPVRNMPDVRTKTVKRKVVMRHRCMTRQKELKSSEVSIGDRKETCIGT